VNGGTPPDEQQALELHQKTSREDMIAAAIAAVPFNAKTCGVDGQGRRSRILLRWRGCESDGRRAALSFAAAVPYYGEQSQPIWSLPSRRRCCLHYAENDERIDKGIPAYEAALKANNKKYTIYVYPGTQHAFTTTPARRVQHGGG